MSRVLIAVVMYSMMAAVHCQNTTAPPATQTTGDDPFARLGLTPEERMCFDEQLADISVIAGLTQPDACGSVIAELAGDVSYCS